jgi:unsaturated chondroitin disaccharide hydrolase
MKIKISTVLITLFLVSCAHKMNVTRTVSDAESQTRLMLTEVQKIKSAKPELISPRTIENGELKLVSSRDWTSGFFAGVLWYLNEFTGKAEWKDHARQFTADMEREKTNAGTHDMGFKIYTSFGHAYRLTGDAHDKEVIIQSARTLSTRFNPVIGCIRSWDHHREVWQFPVIIDNMMNLELLFAATRLTGDSSFYRIAVAHANTTMKNHFRPDFSSFHVVDYDTVTGKVLKKNTHQGYSDESAWSRGQAWALYGYTMCYRETGNVAYLNHAKNIARFLLNHPNLPKDMVPYWDFNAPSIPNEPRDASAAAIMASALYELSTFPDGMQYRTVADKLLNTLTRNYRAEPGSNKGFILLHSTGSKPANSEVDVPINYADYYYMEALMRQKRLLPR